MITILGKIWDFFKNWNPLFKVWAGLGTAAVAVFAWFSELWDNLFAQVDALVLTALPDGVDFSPLALMNYILPLDLLLSYIVAYGALYVVASVIRMIKSFIPTIA